MPLPLFLFMTLVAQAETNAPSADATPATPPVQASAAIPDLKEVAPGILEYHGVRLDKKNQRISFPAVVNQREGLIEYALVNVKGKTHESLFSTKLMPRDIHLGMILIGYKEDASANSKEHVPPTAIDSAYLQSAPRLKGPDVSLTVSWTIAGQKKEVPIEDCILNLQTNKPMAPGAWTYNGSMIEDGAFLADQELSIFAVITDPTTLVNNPRPGYDNDEIWQLRPEVVPALDTPVEINITLLPPASATPEAQPSKSSSP